jgi:hypothetical protein
MAKFGNRFADDPTMQRDEDNLQREDNPDFSRVPNEDEEPDAFDVVFHELQLGDERMIRLATALARCIQEMVTAAARDNQRMLEHWYRQGRALLDEGVPEVAADEGG